MNVKDNRKQDKRPFQEIKPGALFKHGGLYFIKTNPSVYREYVNIVAVKCCIDISPEYEYDTHYEPANAISVIDGSPYRIPSNDLVEVFPKAVICLDDKM